MKIEMNINPDADEKITVSAKQMTPELTEFIQEVEYRFNKPRFNGKLNGHVYPIDLQNVVQFIVIDKVVHAITVKNQQLVMSERLYQIEEGVGQQFVRISKSEIINLEFIDYLKLEPNGMVKLYMKNGNVTYASRRYLKTIKERLSL